MANDYAPSLSVAPILWFCVEAVRRQGLDLRRYEGVVAVARLALAWAHAMSMRRERRYPELGDVIKLARIVDPAMNRNGLRRAELTMDGHPTPPPEDIERQLVELLAEHGVKPVDWYWEFCRIGPLRAFNGRVAVILMNWVAGTLETPFFPTADARGEWVENP